MRQSEVITWLHMSGLERHFYRQQEEECATLVGRLLLRASKAKEAEPLSRSQMAKLMAPLLRLRQACCHPQVDPPPSTPPHALCSLCAVLPIPASALTLFSYEALTGCP